GYRDHDPLAHPAGEFVRIQVKDGLRIVNPDEPQVVQDVLHQRFPSRPAPSTRQLGGNWMEKRLAALHDHALRIVMRLWGREESGRFARIPQLPNSDGFRDLVEDAVRGLEGVE